MEIPPLFEDEMYWALFVRTTIERIEENPNVEFLYGYSVLSKFANDIKTAVNEYYGTAGVSTFAYIESDEDILLDSTVYGEWTDDYKSYNCYAYVINDDESRDPGVFHWMSFGNDASKYSYNCYANMETILSWIEDDFAYLGFTINSVTTKYTETNPRYHINLICVRKDIDGIPWYYDADGVLHYFYDYHFMKLGADGYWYHKPGKTNPLKYNYVPNVDRPWLSEGYNGETGKYSREDGLTYDSEIYFINYTTPCEWIYEQHRYACEEMHYLRYGQSAQL